MKHNIIVAAIISFSICFGAGNIFADSVGKARIMAKQIKTDTKVLQRKSQNNFQEMRKYICSQPDAELVQLSKQVGTARLLADIERIDHPKNHSRLHLKSVPYRQDKSSSRRHFEQQKQLELVMRDPVKRGRLCADLAMYYLNTSK